MVYIQRGGEPCERSPASTGAAGASGITAAARLGRSAGNSFAVFDFLLGCVEVKSKDVHGS